MCSISISISNHLISYFHVFLKQKKNTHFQQLVLSGFRCIFVQLDLIEQMHKEGLILLSRVAMFQNKTHKRPETIPPPPLEIKFSSFSQL